MSSRSNLKLATGEAPPRSPERTALAEAQQRHAAALDAVKRVEQAHEAARETVFRLMDVLKAAEAALKEAQAGGNARLAAIALGEADGNAVDVEAAVQQATADLDVARRTRAALEQRAEREAAEVERAREAIDKAVADVVRSEADVAKLLAKAKAIQTDLIARRVELRFLYNGFLEERGSELRQFLLFEQHLPAGRGQAERGNFDIHPAADPWKASIAALREDADAPLPA